MRKFTLIISLMGGLNNYFFHYSKRKKVVISLVLAHKGTFKNIVFQSALIFTTLLPNMLSAGTEFIIIPNESTLGSISFLNINLSQDQIKEHPDKFIRENDTTIPTGFAMANTLGYPNGKGIIKPLPHFEAGFAVGGSVYKLSRSKDFSKDNPEIPGFGANAAIHFGTGISDNSDLSAKIFFNNGIYNYEKSMSQTSETRKYKIDLKKTEIISFGIKYRYNIIKSMSIVPVLFSFGGVTAGASLDYMYGKISATGSYSDSRDINFNIAEDPITHNTNIARVAKIQTDVQGKAATRWSITSVSPEIMVYADFLYFLTLYTGPVVSFNAGYVQYDIKATGTLKNAEAIYSDGGIIEAVPAGSIIATGILKSNASYKIPPVIPSWKAGIEFNILAVKLQVEGVTVLTSPTDSFSVQAGVRVQF
jgi:hypothetical protein